VSKVTAQAEKASKPSTPKELTGKERRALRALGHALSPVVHIGKAGLTPGVTRELQGALKAHELIKVQLLGECPLDRVDAAERIAKATIASVIQTLGKTLLFYKPNLEKPKISLDGPGSADATIARSRKAASKGVRPKHKAAASRRSDSPSRRSDSASRRSDSPSRRSDSSSRRSGATSRYSRSSGNKK
jgi:RNA-binding protein